MASPKEYFEKDAGNNLRVHAEHYFTHKETNTKVEVIAAVSFDFDAGVRYALLYIPDDSVAAYAISYYLRDIHEVLKVGEGVEAITGFHGTDEQISSKDLDFSGRVLAYTANHLSPAEKQELLSLAAQQKLKLLIRDGAYLDERAKKDVPQAFVSHDSRDKEPFVRELATKLQRMTFSVWYDEYSLKPGDSLRRSIEKGLKECKKVVLVLSPNFFSNNGWTKAEFDSVFTREILEEKDVIIPVWHNITKQQVYDYSPRLLDKVGIPSSLGVEEVALKIVQALR
jgi:hypothetical protein